AHWWPARNRESFTQWIRITRVSFFGKGAWATAERWAACSGARRQTRRTFTWLCRMCKDALRRRDRRTGGTQFLVFRMNWIQTQVAACLRLASIREILSGTLRIQVVTNLGVVP